MLPRIAWIDVETNGLTPNDGAMLLELAAVITDSNYTEIDSIETTFSFDEATVEALRDDSIPFVRTMHDNTGLWYRLTASDNATYEEFDELFSAWLRSHSEDSNLLFGGNSITLDREFVREFLPKSYKEISYHSIDITSVAHFMQAIGFDTKFPKRGTHGAMSDIRESIAQAKYLATLAANNPPF